MAWHDVRSDLSRSSCYLSWRCNGPADSMGECAVHGTCATMQDVEPEIVLVATGNRNCGSILQRARVAADSVATAMALSADGNHLALAMDLPAPTLRVYSTANVRTFCCAKGLVPVSSLYGFT